MKLVFIKDFSHFLVFSSIQMYATNFVNANNWRSSNALDCNTKYDAINNYYYQSIHSFSSFGVTLELKSMSFCFKDDSILYLWVLLSCKVVLSNRWMWIFHWISATWIKRFYILTKEKWPPLKSENFFIRSWNRE